VAANCLRARFEELGIPMDLVTCLVADNSTFGDAVARHLNLHRARCVPHIFALCFEVLVKGLKYFVLCTSGLSALIRAGGGIHRAEALRAAGLEPSRLHCVVTRWCQTQDMAEYLISMKGDKTVFDIVRGLLKEHPAFKGGIRMGGEGEEALVDDAAHEEEGDVKVQVAGQGMVNAGKLLGQVKGAFGALSRQHDFGLFELYLVNRELALRLPAVLTLCGSENNKLPSDIISRMVSVREVWAEVDQSPHLTGVRVGELLHQVRPDKALDEKNFKHYIQTINASCAAAMGKYDEYMPSAIQQLQRRLRFEPDIKPEQIDTKGEQITLAQ
jgi:hypothetical protein